MGNTIIFSPNRKHEIHFGEMSEQAMGGAYCCDIFLKSDNAEPLLLHGRNTENAVWKGNSQVFFPIWFNNSEGHLLQKVAFFDLKKGQIAIFETIYGFVQLKSVKGNIIEAIDSPHWEPKNILIDIKTENLEKQ